MPFDAFTFDTGRKSDYDGTVDSALFVQNEQGNWQLQLVINADDGDEPIIKLGVGAKSGFASYDGGESISGPKPESKLHYMSAYAKFIAASAKAGAEEELRSRSESLYNGYGPMHANLWVGLRFHFEDVMDKSANVRSDDGKWGPVYEVEGDPSTPVVGLPVLTPTKYLGVGNVASTNGQTNVFEATDMIRLRDLARESESFGDFGSLLIALTDSENKPMVANRAVMAQVNQKWYDSVKAEV